MQSLRWVTWNVSLAVIPVLCAYALAAGIKAYTIRDKRVPWIVWLPLALVWLAFLPNTCYLLTEWRHFLVFSHGAQMRGSVYHDREVLLDIAKRSLFYMAYSGVGILCYALSIRPIEQVLKLARVRLVVLAIPFFLLTSLGVYMGLIVRLNSWDILHRPVYVWNVAVGAVTYPPLLETIIVFAGLLWLVYQIVNIWVDGLALRLRKSEPVSEIVAPEGS